MITQSDSARRPQDRIVELDGEPFYRLAGTDRVPPFFMVLPSDSDLWMFITSRGGLTAGRVDADGAIFPYETVDRLYHGHLHTGPWTRFRVTGPGDGGQVWEPFTGSPADGAPVTRNLYKNLAGNRLIFEETHPALGLRFRYAWSACDEFGHVRTCTLEHLGDGPPVEIRVRDGIRNVLPFGAPLAIYQQSSSLVDAYKRTDLDEATGLAIFSLSSRIVDRPEASEELRANTVWCRGLPDARVNLSPDPDDGASPRLGRPGHYFVTAAFRIAPGETRRWRFAADAGLGHDRIAELRNFLRNEPDPDAVVGRALEAATGNLMRNVASADGLQFTGDATGNVHHFANVLFNNLRGGVFASNHDIPVRDFSDFLETRNRFVLGRHLGRLEAMDDTVRVDRLLDEVVATGDANLIRLAHEYLPIFFGRRHGDPSRPWNRFRIQVRNADGSRALQYEGNWRDIFQNWEALAHSFPAFLPGMIAKFVNASTVDGFNPYRVTRDGIDWEVEDPEDPWSYIGYWGDHQIIYLLKLLEAADRFLPGKLEQMLVQPVFSYANVPYRIRAYADLLRDPHETVDFDPGLAERIEDRESVIGTDGRLLSGPDGSVVHGTLLEKLLIPVLAKLANLVPEAGIWMNTQRPEWNDANNALVGRGVSLVTAAHLRRHVRFLADLLEAAPDAVRLSASVAEWLELTAEALRKEAARVEAGEVDDTTRRAFLDEVGAAFSAYRQDVYTNGMAPGRSVPREAIVALLRDTLPVLDHTIRTNRRDDGLYHAYNLLDAPPEEPVARIGRLHEMLEGQVAVLSSGTLDPAECADLVERMFESRLYREDQRSFLLYPARELPSFLERNTVPDESAHAVPLLRDLLESSDTSLLYRDADGVIRFAADFRNAGDVEAALDRLGDAPDWSEAVARDREGVLDVFESVFHHRSFTGRSGTMYGYEGLGCIYWHMVAKLLLAVQEVHERARSGETDPGTLQRLTDGYYRIRGGLGFEKTPREYGAFPTDPYSHTPAHSGAQQPGMTGQVKEEILTRLGELGVAADEGRLRFHPYLLRRSEFLREPGTFRFFSLDGKAQEQVIPAGALAFTVCQVPVVYEATRNEPWIRVTRRDGGSTAIAGDTLDAETSRAILLRTGAITQIDVGVPARDLV